MDKFRLKIISVQCFERPVKMRLPFKFGDTVVHETYEAFLSVKVRINGEIFHGKGAQLMVPRWFDKRANQSNLDTIETLRRTIRTAAKCAIDLAGTAAEICAYLQSQVIAEVSSQTPRLAAGFGPALVEMALIDALCVSNRCNFPEAVRQDIFGLAGRKSVGLTSAEISHFLSKIQPRWDVAIRHTIGYDAPLRSQDVSITPDDDLPVALQDVIRATGVKAFKIKLKGNIDSDLSRLESIAQVLPDAAGIRVTLDANEQYEEKAFFEFLKAYKSKESLVPMHNATLFVEQPFSRDVALEMPVGERGFNLALVIDESDDHDDAFSTAWANGWQGVSVKSCKSVFRALLNFCRVQKLRAAGHTAILSGEDLTCQPGLCFQQDSLMAATIGVQHAERNGHHFAGGMQGASEKERAEFMREHSDIYRMKNDKPQLRIKVGLIEFRSLNRTGFGNSSIVDNSLDSLICNY